MEPTPAPEASTPPTSKLTPSESSSLYHWSLYGQGASHTPITTRTPPPSERQAMLKPASSDWNIPLSSSQLQVLRNGFPVMQMEDKWVVWSGDMAGYASAGEEPTGKRVMKVFMERSWTGALIFELVVEVWMEEKGGDSDWDGERVEVGRIVSLVWETDETKITGQTEEVAKERVREVCRWVLGIDLLPDVPMVVADEK